MIYTYDITTGQVVMVSDAPNTYNNPNWKDIEADADPFQSFCDDPTITALFVEDGEVIPKEES